MEIIEILKALVLGIVEGLTEFAPISSTGHMIIFDDLWLNTEGFLGAPSANTFKIVIQLGSILAVVFVFWKRMLSLVGLYKIEQDTPAKFNILHVVIGIIPAGFSACCLKTLLMRTFSASKPCWSVWSSVHSL